MWQAIIWDQWRHLQLMEPHQCCSACWCESLSLYVLDDLIFSVPFLIYSNVNFGKKKWCYLNEEGCVPSLLGPTSACSLKHIQAFVYNSNIGILDHVQMLLTVGAAGPVLNVIKNAHPQAGQHRHMKMLKNELLAQNLLLYLIT